MTNELDTFDYLVSNIRKQMNDVADHVSTGGCDTYDAYAKCCGIIQGLALAEREILDLKERYDNA